VRGPCMRSRKGLKLGPAPVCIATFKNVTLSTWTARSAKGPRSHQRIATAGLVSVTSNLFTVGAVAGS
jgi:hypothetical protein